MFNIERDYELKLAKFLSRENTSLGIRVFCWIFKVYYTQGWE